MLKIKYEGSDEFYHIGDLCGMDKGIALFNLALRISKNRHLRYEKKAKKNRGLFGQAMDEFYKTIEGSYYLDSEAKNTLFAKFLIEKYPDIVKEESIKYLFSSELKPIADSMTHFLSFESEFGRVHLMITRTDVDL